MSTERSPLHPPERELLASGKRAPEEDAPQEERASELQRLQAAVGNRGMQQLLGGVRGQLGEGAPLPAAVREETEARLGADLGGVRIHDHAAAHALAQQQLARAFTVGTDVVFNRGRYQPGSVEGRHLLAHELTHVVQQTRGGPAAAPGPVHEAAADQAAAALARGGAGPVDAGPAAAPGVQCAPLSEAEIKELLLPQVRAALAANEQEMIRSAFVASDEYKKQLEQENLQLKDRAAALRREESTRQISGTQPAVDKPKDADATHRKVLETMDAELAVLTPLVTRLAFNVPLDPANYALNEVRNLDALVRADEKAVLGYEAAVGDKAAEVHPAVIRFGVLRQMIQPAVAAAVAWHDANPAGESLGMMNERAGVWLAGAGESQWDKGGLHYISGGAAYVGAFGVAFVDAGEKVFTFGFHDAATAVSQAYTRGDISWNEGESILKSAAWRALLIAAVTRGAGAATRGLGVLGAEATGLATTTLRYGAVAGAIPGGISAVAALGTQALLTKGLEDQFKSPAAKAIWQQGMPQGRDWAIAIPMGIIMGGLGGMRGVEISNAKLRGTIINTPEGPMEVVTVTELKLTMVGGKPGLSQPGVMVLKPVGGSAALLPPPPTLDLVMVYDPVTRSWVYPEAPTTGLATVAPAKTAVPGTGGALVPVPATGAAVVASDALANSLAGGGAAAVTGALPKPALPPAKPMKALPAAVTIEALVAKADAAVPSAPVTIPPAPKLPVTRNTIRAAQRLAQAEAALATANQSANLARAKVAKAQGELAAADELAVETGGSKDAKALVKGARADLKLAVAELKPLERSEAAALRERDSVASGGTAVAKIELELAGLDQEIDAVLRPGKYVAPPTSTTAGQAYDTLKNKQADALQRLRDTTKGLSRSLKEQVTAATPGFSGRAIALENAAQLDPALHPVNGMPIDVTTGLPMTSPDWATDHIVSRGRISSDPRFARLTPLQRDAMLLEVPENYLPITSEANSSKLDLTVDEWIAARSANGKPLPSHMIKPLREAYLRAEAAIEAMFVYFLPP